MGEMRAAQRDDACMCMRLSMYVLRTEKSTRKRKRACMCDRKKERGNDREGEKEIEN